MTASVLKKKIAQRRLKNISRGYFTTIVGYWVFYSFPEWNKHEVGWQIFFCRGGLMFSWPNKWEHVSFGRNKTSVELALKNLTDLHWKFFMQHQNKKSSSTVKKNHYLPTRDFKKNCSMSAGKYQSGLLHDWCRLMSFFIQSLNEICMMSVRKCSISIILWSFFFRPQSVIFPGRRRLSFFSINIGE